MTQDRASTCESRVTRLAPSPTGALHLGNARTFLINWALARRGGWRIALRLDDLDSPRIKPGADRGALEDLAWLGLDWDSPPTCQTSELSAYSQALDDLRRRGLIYPCTCSRRDILHAQSAPHEDDHELRYPGTCRLKSATAGSLANIDDPVAWRLRVPDEAVEFIDQFHGPQSVNVQQQVGDFIVATKSNLPSYQLAVVLDDVRQEVTDVVRGDDLLTSTARQIWVHRMLGLGLPPRYWHVPLVVGPDGKRLAKRHGDTRLAWYRRQGVQPQRIIGLLARWCGLGSQRVEMTVRQFADEFDLRRLPPHHIPFTMEDHQWLLGA